MPQMLGPYTILGGVATTIYFSLESPAASSSDRFVTGTVAAIPIVAGDIQVVLGSGAPANLVTFPPVQVTAAKPHYALALTIAETLAEDIFIYIVDQNGPAFRDLRIHLKTIQRMTQLDLDPSAYAVTADVNGLVIAGRGAGIPLQLTPAGATRHTNLFDTPMGSEPSAITGAVGATRSVGQFMQDLWYRFFRKHMKTGSGSSGQVIVYKEDGLAVISTQTASKTGTDQTVEKAS